MTLSHITNLFEYTWNNSVYFSTLIPFFLGAAFGSFLNVIVFRATLYDPKSPKYDPNNNQATINGRSFCPTCGSQIPIWNNVPAISWILLRGKSACCNNPINPQYIAIEWFFGLFLLVLSHLIMPISMLFVFLISYIGIGVVITYWRFKFIPKRLSIALSLSLIMLAIFVLLY